MARDVLMERRVAQAGTLQARITTVDTEAWNARPTQRHRALREGSISVVESRRCLMKAFCKSFAESGCMRPSVSKASGMNEALLVTDFSFRTTAA